MRVEANINGVGQVVPRTNGVQELGVDYLLVAQPGAYTFAIDGVNLALTVVGIDQTSQQAAIFDLGKEGSVDTTPYDYAYVLVRNTAPVINSTWCTWTDWKLSVSAAADDLAVPEAKLWSAANFIPAG